MKKPETKVDKKQAKIILKKIKESKKDLINKLKKDGLYDKYKDFFIAEPTRFIFSFFFHILGDSSMNFDQIYELEKTMIELNNDENMFIENFKKFQLSTEKYRKVNFDPFARYFYYVWQGSRFYKDEKKKVRNIYTRTNYNVRNERKREYFYKWMRNLRAIDPNFNKIILALRKKGI